MSTPLVVSVTDELVAELEALASKATPGPWNYDGSYVCTMRKEDGTTYVESWNPVADALLSKNVHYIAAANPATILAMLAERAELKRDAERLEWLISEQCIVESQNGMNSPVVYRLFWRHLGECQAEWYPSERTAIDAAMQSEVKP